MTTDDVLARGEELRQQGEADGGGLWAMAEYVDWQVEHGEALMRVAEENARLQARVAELEAGRAADMAAYERADDRISEMAMLLIEARRWATRVEPSHGLASYVRRIGVALRESSPERTPDPRVP